MIITKQNYKPYRGKQCIGPSLTVPDQTMSLREILSRHARGLPIAGNNAPAFYSDEEQLDIKHFDLADQEDIIIMRADELKGIHDRIEGEKLTKKQKAEQKERDKLRDEIKAQIQAEQTASSEQKQP